MNPTQPQGTQATVYLCPQCSSPDVELGSTLLFVGESVQGAPVHCKTTGCGWRGKRGDLVAAPFQHSFRSDHEVAEQLARDLRNLMAKVAGPLFAEFLVKYGFMHSPPDAIELRAYLTSLAPAMLKSIIETRAKLQAPSPPPEKMS